MNTFLVHVGDDNFSRVLPEALDRSKLDHGRVKVMAFPPLGIQTLAPILRQRGHQVRMFDTCHPHMKAEHIAQAVVEDRPDAIALSFLSTTTYPAVKAMARRLKTKAAGTPIIVGGAFATLNADRILEDCPDIDCVGVGEGEELLPDYLNHLDDPGSVAGLVWRRDGKTVANPPRPLLRDLDQFPYPDRTSLPIDYIESLPLDVPAVLSLDKFCTVQTSRGCPYSCIYCDIPALGEGRWRSRSPEHVLGELQELNALGYRSIYLTDDHFLINRKRIDEICRGIIERKLEFHWGCEGRVDSVGIEQLPIMRRAGCNFLAFGVEAGTQKVLDRLKKKQTPAQVAHAVREAKRQGIARVHGFFVVGSPDETRADILESFRFAARLELDTFGFNRLCAYRGTPLWQEYVARGIIDDARDWHKWFKCSDIDPTTLPSAEVNRLRAKRYGLLFLHRIFKRPIRTWKLLRSFGRHMKTADLIKLLSSPFRRRSLTRKAELPARMLDLGLEEPDRGAVPDAAAPQGREDRPAGRERGRSIPDFGDSPERSA
ncbi:MAG: B12-binding domain-containing radical SAM protein [Verrucomicrobia bacterium]|nr:B12-binding domain-containing radical SAM protein [Verrucomicrobiota bacterium]